MSRCRGEDGQLRLLRRCEARHLEAARSTKGLELSGAGCALAEAPASIPKTEHATVTVPRTLRRMSLVIASSSICLRAARVQSSRPIGMTPHEPLCSYKRWRDWISLTRRIVPWFEPRLSALKCLLGFDQVEDYDGSWTEWNLVGAG